MPLEKAHAHAKGASLLSGWLPDIELTVEDEKTDYIFTGIYDGSHALTAKLLKLIENDENIKKGADKTNDER